MVVLLGLGLALLFALLAAVLPRRGTAGVSPGLPADLPVLGMPGFVFDPAGLRAKVGQPVALRLENRHAAPHSFDLDELDVHVSAAPGESALVRFTPTAPGRYTFYCAVPGHREMGMQGTLIVEP